MRPLFGGTRFTSISGTNARKAPLADLHMVADGTRIEPIVDNLIARFFVPAGVKDIALVSRTARPCDVLGTEDPRDLGVCLQAVVFIDGLSADDRLAPDDARLDVGVHEVEEGPRRWTSGRTPLPPDLVAAHPNGFFVRVELAGQPLC